ncbi:MAG: sigma-70 family RNA polymerase sigma factor [Gemmataceae bacterium]|nr:sigma-70 family RNA polymerase sigma factor [Gemmataceae bacterium]
MTEQPLTPDARTRAADLYQAQARAVTSRLARRFSGTDPQLISDAVVQAILQLSAHPERYHPQRGSLRAFLTGAARRILATLLRSARRRHQREGKKASDPVTTAASAARNPLEELADREIATRLRQSLDLDPQEGAVLDLWLLGESDTRAYAAALGLATGTPEEQEEVVRRALARLRQRLHRLRERLRPED